LEKLRGKGKKGRKDSFTRPSPLVYDVCLKKDQSPLLFLALYLRTANTTNWYMRDRESPAMISKRIPSKMDLVVIVL